MLIITKNKSSCKSLIIFILDFLAFIYIIYTIRLRLKLWETTNLKNLKKYILAIITCFCLIITSLTGCTFIKTDKAKSLEADALTIGSTVLSKQEVVSLWYNFYSNNSSYFYYYEDEQILDIFYKNVICQYAVMQETLNLIDENVLMYSTGDDAQVWFSVLKSIASSVDKVEKALYEQQGTKDKNLPIHLQENKTSSSEVKSYLYESYNFKGMNDYACDYLYDDVNKTTATNVGDNVQDARIKEMISFFENTYINYFIIDSEEEIEFNNISDLKSKVPADSYFGTINNTENRARAWDMYVSKLMLNAKSSGKKHDRTTVLVDEIKKMYTSSYETYLVDMYSSYVKSSITVEGSKYYSLNDRAIALRYLQLLGADMQNYKLEENYIAVLEAKGSDTLLLYYVNGEYYYFSVQHLLVSFEDEITQVLTNAYGSSANSSKQQYDVYKKIRDTYYKQLGLAGWEEYDNVIYRDENGYQVYKIQVQSDEFYVYFDKDYIVDTAEYKDKEEDEIPNGYYYTDNDSQRHYLTAGEFEDCKPATVTVSTVLNDFNNTYDKTIDILATQADSATAEAIHAILEQNNSVKYVVSVDIIKAWLNAYATGEQTALDEANYKVYANLFMQLAFKYSSDDASLGTKLSNYVGMIISAEPDNHNSGGSEFVSEFTYKSRQLIDSYLEGTYNTEAIGANNFAITDYGVHIITVNNVYKVDKSTAITSTAVDTSKPIDDATIDKLVAEMKTIYISASSSQTLYQYIYEQIRDELVGDSGTVYTIDRNTIYKDYFDQGKAKHNHKFTYDELMELIG